MTFKTDAIFSPTTVRSFLAIRPERRYARINPAIITIEPTAVENIINPIPFPINQQENTRPGRDWSRRPLYHSQNRYLRPATTRAANQTSQKSAVCQLDNATSAACHNKIAGAKTSKPNQVSQRRRTIPTVIIKIPTARAAAAFKPGREKNDNHRSGAIPKRSNSKTTATILAAMKAHRPEAK